MKKINIPRVIWISAIFLILILILLLVMNYKINYEYLSYDYLYFYECDGNLCISQVQDNSKLIYNKYSCGYEECPKYIKNLNDDYVILEKNNKYILYNYRNSKVISDSYEEYEFINNEYIIVTKNNKKGVINIENNIKIEAVYDEIGYRKENYLSGYNLNDIIVKSNENYGIISYKTGILIEEIKYKEEEIDILLNLLKEEK